MRKTNNSENDNKRIFLQYSVLFCIFTAGIFCALIIFQRSFMQFRDSYTQGVFRLLEVRNQARSIASGEGFSFWSWYEGPGMDEPLENFIEPGMIVGALFPQKFVELGLTVAALFRMYLGGIAFILLGRETGLSRRQNLIGSLFYVFSACFIGMAVRQSEMLLNAYLFPLLVWTAERVYKNKSPLPFILTVAFYTAIAIYNAYMSAIVIVIYILIRYWHYNDKFEAKEYLSIVGRFMLYGILGILLSAFTSLFSIATLRRASTDSSIDPVGLLFSKQDYAEFGKIFLGSATTYDYLDIGIPVLLLMLIPVAISRCTKKSTNTIMFIILFVMMMFPFFNSMFNGFGYVSFRWSYTFLLFAVLTGVEQFDASVLKDKKSIALALIGLLVIGIWAVGPNLIGWTSIGISGKFFWLVQLSAGLVLLLVLNHIRKTGQISKRTTAFVLLISFGALSLGWSAGFYGNRNNFAKIGTVHKNLEKSTLRVSNQIEDEGFYRIDSVDGINRHAELRFPANENIWWESNNLFIYNSRIPETLTDFNVQLGNSYGYARRVYVLSNENRAGLDYLYGVRYYLGSDSKKKGFEDSDNYAGYGFELYKTIDGVKVYKNKYDVGLGFVYEKAISEDEFEALDSLYKEQAMMQAAVVSEDEMKDIEDTNLVKADALEYDVKDLPYEIVAQDGLTIEDGKITAKGKDASFTIKVKDIPDSQLVVSFDNLVRHIKQIKDGASYEVYASDGKVTRKAIVQRSRQGVDNLVNHDLNLGYQSGDAEIKITFERDGVYTFDGIHIHAMSTPLYDKHAKECMENCFKVTEYDEKKVSGTVESDKGGILFLSIPVHAGWDVYIDGEKAELIDDLNLTFTGAYVSAGKHEVMLKYDNKYVKIGSLISLICAGIIVLVLRRDRIRRKQIIN
jgi:uncharacterized membrane protein YfhO